MAERTVIDCDKCGKVAKSPIKLVIPNGSEYYFNGVESGYDRKYVERDLCNECATNLLKYMFGHKRIKFKGEEKERWEYKPRYFHADADSNDSVYLALKFFNIKPK